MCHSQVFFFYFRWSQWRINIKINTHDSNTKLWTYQATGKSFYDNCNDFGDKKIQLIHSRVVSTEAKQTLRWSTKNWVQSGIVKTKLQIMFKFSELNVIFTPISFALSIKQLFIYLFTGYQSLFLSLKYEMIVPSSCFMNTMLWQLQFLYNMNRDIIAVRYSHLCFYWYFKLISISVSHFMKRQHFQTFFRFCEYEG